MKERLTKVIYDMCKKFAMIIPPIKRHVEYTRDLKKQFELVSTMLHQNCDLLQSELGTLQQSYDSLQTELDILKQERAVLQQSYDSSQAELNIQQQKQVTLQQSYDSLQAELDMLQQEQTTLQQKYDSSKFELESIKIKNNDDFISGQFWENHYVKGGTSGTGSYLLLAKFKADIVNAFIKKNGINSIIEYGCGDGNQLSYLNVSRYTGVDVSETIVEKNRLLYSDDKTKDFFTTEERDKYSQNQYDIALSMDVIFHLPEDEVFENYMLDLFSLPCKFVIIYASNHEEFTRWKEFRHRKFFKFFQERITGWEFITFIPNKYPYVVGREETTSTSDFYIYKKQLSV